MARFLTPSEMSVQQLCEYFEQEIQEGVHLSKTDDSRSFARRELIKRGHVVLPEVIAYIEQSATRELETDDRSMAENVVKAWSRFCRQSKTISMQLHADYHLRARR